MQISDHYSPFKEKTLIVVTNNEQARLFKAENREVEELETINTSETGGSERHPEINVDFDQMKMHRLKELYHSLSDRLLDHVNHNGYTKIMACVPEVNKQRFADDMHTDVMKRVGEVVPKNLASMDISNIVRILVEG